MCRLGRMGAGHFPVLLAILIVITLALTYVLAVYRKDVDPFFPYISATGSKKPESCIFGQLITFGAFFGVAIVYLRYRLVKELNRSADRFLVRMNACGFVFGISSILGLTIVANFQESAVITVHLTGAFLCFGSGVLYCFFNTVVTYRMYPLYNGFRIFVIRSILAILVFTCFVGGVTAGTLAGREYSAATGKSASHFWFHKGEPGWTAHAVSATCEWVLVVGFGGFLLSFSRDFEKLRVGVAVEPLVQHLDETPVALSPESSPPPNINVI